jgi:phthiocerol/phenolphthiocerol synthesis type-I polyketide synthase E
MTRRGALATALFDEFASAGAVPIFVEVSDSYAEVDERRFKVRYGESDDLAAMTRQLQARRCRVRGAIYIWDAADLGGGAAACYSALVSLADSLQLTNDGRSASLVVATFGAQSVIDEPVRDVTASLALGPVLVLPTEVPGLSTRLVDFEAARANGAPLTVAKALVGELGRDDTENIVAWRGARRWVRRYDRLVLPPAGPGDLPVKVNGVYLITGGLGGIGLTLAKWLAQSCSARLLLTGRTALPRREDWDRVVADQSQASAVCRAIAAVRDIEAAGGDVIVARADVANTEQMQVAIATARGAWGEIDGVVHAAGIAGNGRLAVLKSLADAEDVFSPKVNGLAVLTQVLGARPLDFVVLMSSINAVLGAPGACDYAAGNAVLDAFVDSDQRPESWRNVIAVDWAAWRDVGMAANLVVAESRRALWQESVRLGIPSFAGIEVFSRVLAAGPRRVVVFPYDLAQSVHVAKTPAIVRDCAKPSAGAAWDPTGEIASEKPSGSPTEVALVEIWSELLGIAEIDLDANFFELGGHSLLATRMMSRIFDNFGVRISLRTVFDAPTVNKLAARIKLAQQGSDSSVSEVEDEREEFIF